MFSPSAVFREATVSFNIWRTCPKYFQNPTETGTHIFLPKKTLYCWFCLKYSAEFQIRRNVQVFLLHLFSWGLGWPLTNYFSALRYKRIPTLRLICGSNSFPEGRTSHFRSPFLAEEKILLLSFSYLPVKDTGSIGNSWRRSPENWSRQQWRVAKMRHWAGDTRNLPWILSLPLPPGVDVETCLGISWGPFFVLALNLCHISFMQITWKRKPILPLNLFALPN